MNWNQLLTTKRLGREDRYESSFSRTEFQKDYDRIVFSSAFRRLQNKTQVMPLPGSDYVRNRLTHSLETASVGRSLGFIVGEKIFEKYKPLRTTDTFSPADMAAVVSAACLAHDVGNPPFGHAGEDAISGFFKKSENSRFLDELSVNQVSDLQNFEGNAAGFRILSSTLPRQSEIKGGLGLTYSTLATFTKYPKPSTPNLRQSGRVSEKKYGFFDAELNIFKAVSAENGLIEKQEHVWCRHPLAFLVEAADDLCYHIIDFEDGFNSGFIEFGQIEDLFLKILGDKQRLGNRYQKIHDERSKINFLRSVVINHLVDKLAGHFIDREEDILSGLYEKALLDDIEQSDILEEIIKLSVKKIYKSRPVIEIEAAGYKVIQGLLEVFLNATFDPGSKEHKLLLGLVPDQFKIPLDKGNHYETILNISMFVSGMTDKYALNLFKKINGISLPEY